MKQKKRLRKWYRSDCSERPGGDSCRAKPRCVPPSSDVCTDAAPGHLGCAACRDSSDAVPPIDPSCRQPLAQRITVVGAISNSHAAVSGVAAHRDVAALRGSMRGFLPPAGPRWAMPSKAAFPEEHPGPSITTIHFVPLPRLIFSTFDPFFGWSETAVQKGLASVELLALVQFRQERAPNSEPDLLLFPIPQSPPACRR
jgi:hypothetical protein